MKTITYICSRCGARVQVLRYFTYALCPHCQEGELSPVGSQTNNPDCPMYPFQGKPFIQACEDCFCGQDGTCTFPYFGVKDVNIIGLVDKFERW